MELREELVNQGFRKENGTLVKFTKYGRKRKNWKSSYRRSSRFYLKDKCEKCGTKENLTIHHVIPLDKDVIITEENCETLCEPCHNKIHNGIPKKQKKNKVKKTRKKPIKIVEFSILKLEQDAWGSYRII